MFLMSLFVLETKDDIIGRKMIYIEQYKLTFLQLNHLQGFVRVETFAPDAQINRCVGVRRQIKPTPHHRQRKDNKGQIRKHLFRRRPCKNIFLENFLENKIKKKIFKTSFFISFLCTLNATMDRKYCKDLTGPQTPRRRCIRPMNC